MSTIHVNFSAIAIEQSSSTTDVMARFRRFGHNDLPGTFLGHPRGQKMADESVSLFHRLGGASGIAEIVEDMYQRVLDDPELAHFFAETSMERLRRMQFQFMASALDGPVEYAGTELNMIHRGRGITGHHFAKFCGHFADALEARNVDPNDLDRALGRLATYKDKITGDSNVDG